MTFKHNPIDLGYKDLTCETKESGRKYVAPDGKDYPSVTTVLKHLSEDAIRAWRARVGEKEANKVITRQKEIAFCGEQEDKNNTTRKCASA